MFPKAEPMLDFCCCCCCTPEKLLLKTFCRELVKELRGEDVMGEEEGGTLLNSPLVMLLDMLLDMLLCILLDMLDCMLFDMLLDMFDWEPWPNIEGMLCD